MAGMNEELNGPEQLPTPDVIEAQEQEQNEFVLKHYGSREALREFCRRLPKVECHAHINGSMSPAMIEALLERKGNPPDLVASKPPQLHADPATFQLEE
ncbi:hypothetical protein HK102_009296 [Quaeritorhiza haematococci]|nr:hypothetical protein HK102_009296 [Quaeritorhiza haematococci]